MELAKEYRFEAAHRLPKVPDGHQCGHIHGHSYRVDVHVEGEVDEILGWVIDYGDLSVTAKPLIEELDHRYLNEIDGLENPTSEMLAQWLWWRIAPEIPQLSAITVHETATSSCTFRGK